MTNAADSVNRSSAGWCLSLNFDGAPCAHHVMLSAKHGGSSMAPFRAYAFGGGMFTLIGIAAIARHDILPGILMFVVAIGCAFRARSEWKRDHA